MNSRHTSSVPKEDVLFPTLLYSDSSYFQTCRWHTQDCCRRPQVYCRRTLVLPSLSPAHLVTLKADWNALLWSDTLLKLTHQNLHSTPSQTPLEASSD
jgi:hypothetical protein